VNIQGDEKKVGGTGVQVAVFLARRNGERGPLVEGDSLPFDEGNPLPLQDVKNMV